MNVTITYKPLISSQAPTVASFVRDQDAGFKNLEHYELGYGARVLAVTPTRVVTEKTVFGLQDRTVFEGTAAEMRALVRLARQASGQTRPSVLARFCTALGV